jgi:membrane protease subunit HflK
MTSAEQMEKAQALPPEGAQTRSFSGAGFLQWLRYYVHLLGWQGKGAYLIVVLVLIGWINSGIYKVQPDEQGVVLRFGKWTETTSPGLHYHLPFPFETVLYPKVTQVNQLQLGSVPVVGAGTQDDSRDRQMLTGDENIVEAGCSVLWRIKDAGQYLFKIREPEAALKISAESALREVIGRTPIQAAMSDKRQQIADQTRDLLQSLLDSQHSGILVTQVQLQRVDPPAAVIDAFNDVQRARADQERARNEAEAYANDILPRARGEASHINQESEAYKSQVVNLAEGEAKGFMAVYASYAKAKDVTAWRLYLESVDEVLKKAGKVIIDTSGKGVSGVVPYLPMRENDRAAAKGGAK